MEKKKSKSIKAIVSVAEYEKKYMPDSFKKKIKESNDNPGSFGEELAKEFLKSVKRQLSS